MKKTKMDKGITLIALIITIVVLLILAVVAINAITNDGILSYAIKATENYNKSVEEEGEMLNIYMNFLNGNTGADEEDTDSGETMQTIWTQNKTSVTNGKITLEVGDYVDYKAGVNGYTDTNGWKVLGAENGQLLLISTSTLKNGITLNRPSDLLNNSGIDKMNAECEPYGKGKYATGARCIKIEDINRVTGYNPETPLEVTYYLTDDGYVAYSVSNGETGTSEKNSFKMPDGTVLTKDNPITVEDNFYFYYPDTLKNDTSGDVQGISKDSLAYKTLFLKNDETTTDFYYCASVWKARGNDGGSVYFGYNCIVYGAVYRYSKMWGSDWSQESNLTDNKIRAVVYLDSEIKLTSKGTNSWTIS